MKPLSRDEKLLAAASCTALLARFSLAVLTEFKQVFPDYYFNDAVLYDAVARRVLAAWSSGDTRNFISPGMEAFALMTASLYKVFGPAPFVVKAANALLGACACACAAWTAASLAGRRAAIAALALSALWPSHVFYTSQAFKEAPTLLFLAGMIGCTAAALNSRRLGRAAALAAAGAACTVAAGFFRPHLVPFLALTGVVGGLAFFARRGRKVAPRAAAVLLLGLGGAALYKPVKVACDPYLFGYRDAAAPFLRPAEVSERPNEFIRPTSPEGITAYRNARQFGNRAWARSTSGREVETEFFPNAAFESWLDVALFLPKASFYELFMPLPGLYPMAGKLGRQLAAAENVLVLLGVFAAAWGFWRLRRRPAAWALAAFIMTLTPAAALFEFDLGSASRHRLQPLSAALPLAAAGLTLRRKRKA